MYVVISFENRYRTASLRVGIMLVISRESTTDSLLFMSVIMPSLSVAQWAHSSGRSERSEISVCASLGQVSCRKSLAPFTANY